jgi:drug/metabolite transporter (DMT)-like permease
MYIALQKIFMKLIYLKLVATVFFWGSNFAVSKIALESFSPAMAALIRFIFGTIFLMVAYLNINGFRLPSFTSRQWFLVFLSAFSGVFCYNFFFFGAMGSISAVRASLLITSSTIFIMLLSAILFKERITFIKWIGLFITLVGVAVVIVRGDFSKLGNDSWGIGETLIILTSLSWTFYTLLAKVVLKEMNALSVSAFSALIGTMMLFFPVLNEHPLAQIESASLQSILAVIYIGSTATALGFVWYYEAVIKIGATNSAVIANLTPVFAVVVAIALGEELTLITAIGGIVVLFGIWLTNKS